MPSKKLSALFVERVRPPESGRVDYWDTQVSGLGLRVSRTGRKTWNFMYRWAGEQIREKVGTYPTLSLGEARKAAGGIKKQVELGIDPKEQARKRLAMYDPEQRLDKIAQEFIERYAKPRNKSWKETLRILERDMLSKWADRPIKTIERREVIQLLDEIVERGAPIMANRVLAQVRRFFNWCVERGILDSSPATNIRAPSPEMARDRVLSDDEIARLWGVFEELGWPFGVFTKMLLLTGQRRSEVAGMEWHEIDLEERLWTIPREKTKADRAHLVPLTDTALEILESLPQTSEYVFSTTGNSPISGFSKAKHMLDDLSCIRDWKLHDLRRTVASGMARLGVAPHIIEKVSNRQTGIISGVAGVYNRYDYLDEKREALEKWKEQLTQITSETQVTEHGLDAGA